MKKRSTILLSLAAAAGFAASGLYLAGCTQTETTATANPPTNLMAVSASSSSVALKWTRDPNESGADTVYVNATPLTSGATTGTNAVITGLTEGTQYTFTVHNSAGASQAVVWMTARRTPASGAAPLRIYQYSSPNPSGLQLNGNTGTAQVVSVTSTNSANVDFLLDDSLDQYSIDPTTHRSWISSPTGMVFEAAEAFDATWKNSWIDPTARYVVGGLDSDWSSASFASVVSGILALPDTSRGDYFPIPADASYGTKGSRVLLVLTAAGNFAKIEIVPQSDGRLYGGTWPDQYIDVRVSYQSSANQAYAQRALPVSTLHHSRHIPVQ